MAAKPEVIRQAKKFLENKNISIKTVKPHLFAIDSNTLKKKFNEIKKNNFYCYSYL